MRRALALVVLSCVVFAACGGPSEPPPPVEEDVAFAFPVRDRTNVKGLVPFGAYGPANPHNGIDFRPYDHLERMEILSPASGTVTAAREVQFGGLRHVQVDVTVNSHWQFALVFEPMTLDNDLFARQLAAVTARTGQRLAAGDPVGALLLGGTAGPPTVHFLATRERLIVCPYNYSTAAARADYDFIAANGTENYLPEGKICVLDEFPI